MVKNKNTSPKEENTVNKLIGKKAYDKEIINAISIDDNFTDLQLIDGSIIRVSKREIEGYKEGDIKVESIIK